MKCRFRLTKSADFKRVWRSGRSFAHPLIVLFALKNEREQSRFAVAAGRTVGKSVQRNRAKRLLRAALQGHIASIEPGWDLILLARRPITEASYREANAALISLLKRARLMKKPHDD